MGPASCRRLARRGRHRWLHNPLPSPPPTPCHIFLGCCAFRSTAITKTRPFSLNSAFLTVDTGSDGKRTIANNEPKAAELKGDVLRAGWWMTHFALGLFEDGPRRPSWHRAPQDGRRWICAALAAEPLFSRRAVDRSAGSPRPFIDTFPLKGS